MTDIVGTARSAREMLARGLNALQSDPNAPAEFLNAAEPIAAAMGALHRIEKSGGTDLTTAPQALEQVRAALALLQARAGTDARFNAVLEEVAGSLGMVFTLNKAASYGPAPAQAAPAQPAPQPAAPYSPPPAAQQPFAAPAQPMRPAMQQPPAPAYAPPQQAFAPQQQPMHQPAPWQQPQAAPQPAYPQPIPAQPQAPAPPQQMPSPQAVPAYAPPPQAFAAQPYAPPQQPAPYAPPQQAYAPPQQPAPQPVAQPVAAAGYRDAEKLPLVEAELGTHSVSNFYRGLSGNDVIEGGGIFVSTYNIPQIGQRLRLRVALPGGLEFEAIGVVRWVREARESMASDISPPGFGLQFTNISADGRNLVYRYVRNREPMFHDDL